MSLPGDPSYSSIVEGAQFKFSITFPGPVTDISGSYGAKADGNTVTWTNPRVLNTGFAV
ncbi:LppM family (lipo)protein, partial [Aerococcus urinae]|uniref:LppM family (lipo)protein n=1 Tax=Aerococcus urinae TaxID=1376 RepID=UPI003F7BE45A